jgi:hypothetical protein
MPQSDHWAVPYVVETAIAVDPGRVLDVGVGMGQYGVHLRQALDIARGRLAKADWTMTLDGVELFAPYRNPIWDHYYNRVTIGDARDVLSTAAGYDLVLLCDVIEHFEKPDALSVLAAARTAARWVLVTTPAGDYPQGEVHGNAAETHRSAWTPAEFGALGAFTHVIRDTFLAVLPGDGHSQTLFRPGDLPSLFDHTAGSLVRCARQWLPLFMKSKLGR